MIGHKGHDAGAMRGMMQGDEGYDAGAMRAMIGA